MDTLERNQVRLILEHLSSETLRETEKAQKALHAEHSAKRCLQSGSTVQRAVDIIEEQASTFVEQACDKASSVAQDMDAFNVITASLSALFRGFEAHLQNAVRLATGGRPQGFESVDDAGKKLFTDAQTRIFKQLEIHRFSFTKPSRGDLTAIGNRVEAPPVTKMPRAEKRNPGGKPLAPHWDAMWAAIAVKLWMGDLKPKSQADVKEAMFNWFNEAEIDVGDTALTQRARQLWHAMQEADS